jgi:hypothetical protein
MRRGRVCEDAGAVDGLGPTSDTLDPPGGGPRAEPRRLVVFVAVLVALPTLACGVLLAAGAAVPAPGPVLLLVVVAALTVNRGVFFPSEQAATAEVAVVLAAITGLAGDAPWIGPLAVALVMGPIDVSHWQSRSLLRVAYNSGNRGVATLAATAAFAGLAAVTPDAVAAVGAAAAFVLVDLAVASTLLVLRGTSGRLAVGRLLAVDRFAFPLAVLGAAVGFAADRLGWTAAALLLAPLAFAPELLILARARRTWSRSHRHVACVLALGIVAVCLLWASGPSVGVATGVALLAVAVLVGSELEVDVRAPVPPLLVVVVVASVVVVSGAGAYVLAPSAALVAVLTAWSGTGPRPTRARAVATAAVVVLSSLATVALAALIRASVGVVAAALLVAAVVPAAAVAVGGRRWRRLVAIGWSAPFVAVAATIAGAWRVIGPAGALLFAVWIGAVVLVARSFGALPWRGRLSCRADGRLRAFPRRGALSVMAATAALCAVVSVSSDSELATATRWLVVAVVASMAAVDLVGIRQWRLAPRARLRATALAVTAAAGSVAATIAAPEGSRWWIVPALAGAAVLVVAGWVPARCADATRPATAVGDRRP